MNVTEVELNLAPEAFRLQHLLDTNLLAKAEEIEEICSSAVKEEAVEKKLTAMTARWSSAVFTFADYKTRGPVLLQVCCILEVLLLAADPALQYLVEAQNLVLQK